MFEKIRIVDVPANETLERLDVGIEAGTDLVCLVVPGWPQAVRLDPDQALVLSGILLRKARDAGRRRQARRQAEGN